MLWLMREKFLIQFVKNLSGVYENITEKITSKEVYCRAVCVINYSYFKKDFIRKAEM